MIWEWWRERAKGDGSVATREAVEAIDQHREELERRADLIESVIEAIRRDEAGEEEEA